MNSQPTVLFSTYFNFNVISELWSNYQKHVIQINLNHITLKFSFASIWGLCSNSVDCGFFLELNSAEILALCETNLDNLIDSGKFLVTGYLHLIRKDSTTHMRFLTVYLKEGLPFAGELSLENCADSYLCFRLVLLHSVSYFFSLYQSLSSPLLHSFWFYFI